MQNPDAANRGKTPDNPVNLAYPHVVSRTASLDGVITFPAASGLGVWAVDSSGNASAVRARQRVRRDCITRSRTAAAAPTTAEPEAQLQPKTSRDNVFAYLEHDFTDNFKVYGQAMYGEASFTNKNLGGSLLRRTQRSRYSRQPFLPAEHRAA